MKTVKLSDFSPYDKNKGGIQELHHKIEPKTLQYWGEDSGILIGISPLLGAVLVQYRVQQGQRMVRELLHWRHAQQH